MSMINYHFGKEHVFTNRSENDTIVLRAGKGEKLVVEGISEGGGGGGSGGFPIVDNGTAQGLGFDGVLEVPKTDITIQDNYFGMDVSFNKYHNNYNKNTTNKNHKFMVASSHRLQTAGTGYVQPGGFTVFDENLEEVCFVKANRVYTGPQDEYPLFRRGRLHGNTTETVLAVNLGLTLEPNPTVNMTKSLNTVFDVYQGDEFFRGHDTATQANSSAGEYITNTSTGSSVTSNYFLQWGHFQESSMGNMGVAKLFERGNDGVWDDSSPETFAFCFLDADMSENPVNVTIGADEVIFCGIDDGGNFRMYKYTIVDGLEVIGSQGSFPTSPYYPGCVACCYGYYFVACGSNNVNIFSAQDANIGTLLHSFPVSGTVYSCGVFQNNLVLLTATGIYLYELSQLDYKLLDIIVFEPGALFESFPLNGLYKDGWNEDTHQTKMIDIFFDEVLVSNPMLQKVYIIKLGLVDKNITHKISINDDDQLELLSPGIKLDTTNGVLCNNTMYFNKLRNAYQAIVFESFNGSTITTAGNISVNGNTTTYGTSSDYRLKENVRDLSEGLETILQLTPKNYKFKNGNVVHSGFLAHELQKFVPNAVVGKKDEVDEDGNPVYQTVDLSKLVPYLVAAIQELYKLIMELKKGKEGQLQQVETDEPEGGSVIY